MPQLRRRSFEAAANGLRSGARRSWLSALLLLALVTPPLDDFVGSTQEGEKAIGSRPCSAPVATRATEKSDRRTQAEGRGLESPVFLCASIGLPTGASLFLRSATDRVVPGSALSRWQLAHATATSDT